MNEQQEKKGVAEGRWRRDLLSAAGASYGVCALLGVVCRADPHQQHWVHTSINLVDINRRFRQAGNALVLLPVSPVQSLDHERTTPTALFGSPSV